MGGGGGSVQRKHSWFLLPTQQPRIWIRAQPIFFSLYCLVCGHYGYQTHLELSNGFQWWQLELSTTKNIDKISISFLGFTHLTEATILLARLAFGSIGHPRSFCLREIDRCRHIFASLHISSYYFHLSTRLSRRARRRYSMLLLPQGGGEAPSPSSSSTCHIRFEIQSLDCSTWSFSELDFRYLKAT